MDHKVGSSVLLKLFNLIADAVNNILLRPLWVAIRDERKECSAVCCQHLTVLNEWRVTVFLTIATGIVYMECNMK